MLVKEWMSRLVVTISPEVNMKKAREIMIRNHIHSLPVLRGGKLVGLLTDRDLARAEASDATSLDVHELSYLLEKTAIEHIMRLKPVTVDLHTTLSEAATLFIEYNIESLPVIKNGDQLVGILTRSDLGRAFLAMTSFRRRGIQIGIRMVDRHGSILDLIASIHDAEARIASIISTDDPGHQTRDIHLHIYKVDRDRLPDLLAYFQHEGSLLYMVDLTNNERFIYAAEE